MPDTNQLIKLFFGTSAVSNAATELLKQNQICRKKIDFLLQEVNKNVSTTTQLDFAVQIFTPAIAQTILVTNDG